jgi:large subunit ribosomal protein L22
MEKTYISKQKFLLGSPRKLRLVVALIKKMKPVEAVEKLPFVAKKASSDLLKVIKSALANARFQGATDTDLVFKEIQVGQGPSLKRGRAASRGRWHPYKKRMSHITIVLTEGKKKEVKVEEVKPVKKVIKKNVTKS